ILPAANKVDVDELPESVREGITIHYASHFKDVAKLMFGIRMRPKRAQAASAAADAPQEDKE
ncbi:MAG TPA: S16 family serine protease, partial [Mariprofundaceae bacterium]|nr:S16 family serine protease [Mariprofundaceae bacterium]